MYWTYLISNSYGLTVHLLQMFRLKLTDEDFENEHRRQTSRHVSKKQASLEEQQHRLTSRPRHLMAKEAEVLETRI